MAVADAAPATGRASKNDRAAWTDFAHTGPGTLAGRWMRMFWHPVFRSRDLPAGRAMPIRVMSQDYTLYRGQEGAVHLLDFRCAHRGTQLSTGWVEGDNLRCFYHGWMYDGSGQCVEQPAERAPFAEKVRVGSYPVEEYLGLIFAYLGEGAAPPLMRYPEFEDSSRGLLEPLATTIPCNYFNVIDNDPIHIYFVHRTFNAAQGRADIPDVECEETEYGYEARATDSVGSWRYHCYAPNMVHGRRDGNPKGEAIQWRVPIDDENTANYGVNLVYLFGDEAEAYRERRLGGGVEGDILRAENRRRVNETGASVLRGELHIDEVTDRSIQFNVQDFVSQVGCGPIVDIEHQHLGREDATAIMLRKIFQRELKALADGKPTKQWTRPAEPMYLGNVEIPSSAGTT